MKDNNTFSLNESLDFEFLANNDPKQLLEIISSGNLPDNRLTFAAESAGVIQGFPQIVPILLKLTYHESSVVREGAAYGLAYHISVEEVSKRLQEMTDCDISPAVRAAVKDVLLSNDKREPQDKTSELLDFFDSAEPLKASALMGGTSCSLKRIKTEMSFSETEKAYEKEEERIEEEGIADEIDAYNVETGAVSQGEVHFYEIDKLGCACGKPSYPLVYTARIQSYARINEDLLSVTCDECRKSKAFKIAIENEINNLEESIEWEKARVDALRESRRTSRENYLKEQGFDKPSEEQRRKRLALNIALCDWPKE